jgi:hypothetical protein
MFEEMKRCWSTVDFDSAISCNGICHRGVDAWLLLPEQNPNVSSQPEYPRDSRGKRLDDLPRGMSHDKYTPENSFETKCVSQGLQFLQRLDFFILSSSPSKPIKQIK